MGRARLQARTAVCVHPWACADTHAHTRPQTHAHIPCALVGAALCLLPDHHQDVQEQRRQENLKKRAEGLGLRAGGMGTAHILKAMWTCVSIKRGIARAALSSTAHARRSNCQETRRDHANLRCCGAYKAQRRSDAERGSTAWLRQAAGRAVAGWHARRCQASSSRSPRRASAAVPMQDGSRWRMCECHLPGAVGGSSTAGAPRTAWRPGTCAQVGGWVGGCRVPGALSGGAGGFAQVGSHLRSTC